MPKTLFRNARLADGASADIAVEDGRIVAIGTGAEPGTYETVDLLGALVVPSFVDGHIHLDTTLLGEPWRPHKPNTGTFDVLERVRFQRENLRDAAPVEVRAAAEIALCLANGTTRIRSHVDINPTVGLTHLEVLLAVREAHRDLVSIQIVAFPQDGILAAPGTADLLDQAVAAGADLVGGLDPASLDRDVEAHLEIVFGVAERHGVGVDIHLHDGHSLGLFELDRIAARTRALGMAGRVAVSHAYALGDVPLDAALRTADALAASGVAIMTNAPGANPFPPVKALRAAGVTVFSGNDNIRDSWWPYGDGDMLNRAMLIGYRSGFYTDEDLAVAFDLVTAAGARALQLDDHGLRVGARADFVVLPAENVPAAVAAPPRKRAVYSRGRLVARDGELVR